MSEGNEEASGCVDDDDNASLSLLRNACFMSCLNNTDG
jgi:hypothetical protein